MGKKGVSTKTSPIYDMEKVRQLLAIPGRDGLYFAIALYTGLRFNEITSLKWGDLVENDIPKDRGNFKISKQNIFREIPFNAELRAKIKETYTHQPLDRYVFLPARGGRDFNKPLSERGVNRCIIQKHFRELGIVTRNASTHALRKTLARIYYEKYDLAATMRLFGHSSERVTLAYIGVEEEEVTDKLKSISFDAEGALGMLETGAIDVGLIKAACTGFPEKDHEKIIKNILRTYSPDEPTIHDAFLRIRELI